MTSNRQKKQLFKARHPEAFKAQKAGQMRRHHARKYVELKAQMIEVLGGVCVCCGESEPGFLTLDHIQGGGRWHRGTRPKTYVVWQEAIDDPDRRDKYRLLCWNCNCATSYGRICPHNRREVEEFLKICHRVSDRPAMGQLLFEEI